MGLVVAVLAVVCMGAAGTGTAAAATVKPRTVLVRDINQVRHKFGLGTVRPSAALHLVALRHSDDMINRDYFAHTSPSGRTFGERIVSSGFVNGWSWMGGETLAWGTGTLSAPISTVKAWLGSPEHRAILLSPRWTRIGIARACGHFLGHRGACVWTADWVERW